MGAKFRGDKIYFGPNAIHIRLIACIGRKNSKPKCIASLTTVTPITACQTIIKNTNVVIT